MDVAVGPVLCAAEWIFDLPRLQYAAGRKGGGAGL